jgi:hypothetical protein
MKTIQGMIAQYFIMKNNGVAIDFVNASNKLKDKDKEKDKEKDKDKDKEPKEKTTYSERKKQGIEKTLLLLETTSSEWLPFFKNHKKKDDLADSYLQGVWYLSS